jgi:hypothetical protein
MKTSHALTVLGVGLLLIPVGLFGMLLLVPVALLLLAVLPLVGITVLGTLLASARTTEPIGRGHPQLPSTVGYTG